MKIPAVKAIGPKLGLANEFQLKILIGLPFNSSIESVLLRVKDVNKTVVFEQLSLPLTKLYNDFVFTLKTLIPGKLYFYEFIVDEIPLTIENLELSDLNFYAPNSLNNQSVCLVSCNNPFEFKNKHFDKFGMWNQLHQNLDREKNGLIIYAGDQVYNDSIEEQVLNISLSSQSDIEKNKQITSLFIENYYKFWEYPAIKKIHAQVPGIMMWDDHDITDGWGGRPESFIEKEFKPEWSNLFKKAKECFLAYQVSTNPTSYTQVASSCFLDIGDKRIYMMDFRTEKNIRKEKLISDEHLSAFFSTFESLPTKNKYIMIVSPVVPVRVNPKREEQIEQLSNVAYQLRASIKKNYPKIANIITKLQIADLGDDVSDGLTSKANKATFLKILNFLLQNVLADKKVIFLTGDIHTGGSSEIIIEDKVNKKTFVIPQVVSSSIGYEPMQSSVRNQTTEDEEIMIDKSDLHEITARNIKYVSLRNFAFILTLNSKIQVEHHYEGQKYPYRFNPVFLQESIFETIANPNGIKKKETSEIILNNHEQ